jgi:putative membrane protein
MKFLVSTLVLSVAIAANENPIPQSKPAEGEAVLLEKISQDNLYELEAAKSASQMADAEEIKDLAWKEVRDHELIAHDLTALASAGSITLSTRLTPESQQKLDRIKSASGRDFDDAYLAAMIAAHKADQLLLASESASGESPEAKAFAARTEPILKKHLASLQNQ